MNLIDLSIGIKRNLSMEKFKAATRQLVEDKLDEKNNDHVRDFLKMTIEYPVQTPYDILQVIYVNHCNLVIIISKCTFQKYSITIYNCVNNTISQNIELEGDFICVRDIEYHDYQVLFGVPYFDAGTFHIIIFNEHKVI